jgi:replicative DNA helicase
MNIYDLPCIGNFYDNPTNKRNPFTEHLKKYDLMSEKKIPKEYIINNREIRMKLLAGIIDSDGSLSNDGKRLVIQSSSEILARDIEFLCSSLGFVVNVSVNIRKNMKIFTQESKDYKDQYIINVSGRVILNEIPTILPRKKCNGTKSNKDYLQN